MPVWLHVLWYVLAVASVVVFAYGIYRLVAKWGAGEGGTTIRAREVPRRLWAGARMAFSQRTVGRRDWLAGGAHALIFYGFLVLFAGTVVLAFQTDFTDPLFGWTYFHGDFYLVYKETLNVFGTALILGVLVMMVRRALIRPKKLDYSRPDRAPDEPQYDRRVYRVGDWAFVVILLVITLTGFVLEGVRIAMEAPGYGGTQFGGWVIAQGLAGVSESTLAALRHGLWWFHGLLAIAWVACIPYTKASHMVTSYLSLALRDPLAGKRLKQAPEERAELPAGYATLTDFRPLHLLNLDACTKCGKCHVACPANATGKPLSPRDVILELREQSNAAAARAGIGGVLGGLLDRGGVEGDGYDAEVIGEHGVKVETLWSCMQCNACVEACPVGIEQAPIINLMRQHLVEEGEMEPTLQSTLRTVHKSGNSFGENKRRRGRWTKELDFKVKDTRKEPVELLWFVGDYASFEPRAQRVTLTIARLLNEAGVDFGILYDAERNSGNDIRRVGEEGLFEALAEENIANLAACEFDRILTSDPHSLNTLRNEYPELGGEDAAWKVVHHTALLLELIEAGKLELGPLRRTVTYHDPCHLGRFNGEYEGPRAILERLGLELREMPRNRDQSFCCGAGGGRIWMTDEPGCERPSENRIHEAVGLGAVDYFVVACPKDVVMYEDAIKTSGNAERIELREIAELIEESVLVARPAALA